MSVLGAYEQKFRPDTTPSGFEVWSWFFMRISGLALVFLVMGHMIIMHLIDGGVDRIDFNFVADRWNGFLWRAYDFALLVLAMLHGAIGARLTIHDHIRKPKVRALAKVALYSVVVILLGVGTLVIATFDPSRIPGGT
ncbi:MAG: succinate dehydrogenase hydrophobic membrane anchor subunit [Actinomycetota bacterium]